MDETSQPQPQEIQSASPRAQILALVLLAVFALVGFWTIADLKAQVREAMLLSQSVSPRAGAEELLRVGDGFFRMASFWLAGVGFYLGLVGVRIRRTGRYPAPGFGVLRATRVLHGDAARRRATITLLIAMIVLVGAAILPVWGVSALREALAEPLASPAGASEVDPLFDPAVPGRT